MRMRRGDGEIFDGVNFIMLGVMIMDFKAFVGLFMDGVVGLYRFSTLH